MNPFTDGKIVGVNYDSRKYHAMQAEERGHRDYLMSRSELMEFDNCAQRWLRGVEEETDKSMEFGAILDCMITEPKALKTRYAITPLEYMHEDGDVRRWNFNANPCKLWKTEQEEKGKIIAKAEMRDHALAAEARLKEDRRIWDLIKGSDKQVCVTTFYKSPSTKLIVAVKVLIDFVPITGPSSDCLADLKTAANASPRKWQRHVFDFDYHVQAAMYLDAYNSVPSPKQARTRFLHVIVENVKPFEPARRELSQEFIDLGRMRYVGALERYCQCLKSKQWPGFDDEGNDIVNGWRLVQPEPWMIQ